MLKKLLANIGLLEKSQDIYSCIVEYGPQSARQISEHLGVPRPTVYDNLNSLIKHDLVIEHQESGKRIYSIDSIDNLANLLQLKIDELQQEKRDFNKIIATLEDQTRSSQPRIKFYPGIEGIRQVLSDLLWQKDIETLTMWPVSDMVDILGEEYMENLNKRRIRQNISIRGIWPKDKLIDFKTHPFLGVGKKHLRSIRYAPEKTSWDMSYWIYNDKVAFISSRKESFGFVVTSRDFVQLLKFQFEIIWNISKPVRPQPKYTDEFLNKV